MSALGDRAGDRASPAGGTRRGGSPYRTSARPEEPSAGAPKPVALGFVIVWFLLAIQAFRVWGDASGSRGLVGLGIGIVVLCVVVPCVQRGRSR